MEDEAEDDDGGHYEETVDDSAMLDHYVMDSFIDDATLLSPGSDANSTRREGKNQRLTAQTDPNWKIR